MTRSCAPDHAPGQRIDPRTDPVGQRSAAVTALFTAYARRFFRRSFHALRVTRAGVPGGLAGRPLIICTNHPSWWDPLLFVMLMPLLFPGRTGYGPMAAEALGRYGLFRRLGIFGIDAGAAGARFFLQAGRHVLDHPGRMLWVTAQGDFTDARVRPVRLRPGLAHLARRVPGAVVVPMAMDYPFWNERFPEALVHFGTPVSLGDAPVEAWQAALQGAMTSTLDALAADAVSRDPARFRTLIGGRVGVGGVYDAWRRTCARLVGRRFDPSHDVVAP